METRKSYCQIIKEIMYAIGLLFWNIDYYWIIYASVAT